MAFAKKRTRKNTKVVFVPAYYREDVTVVEDGVSLELTQAEATTLRIVLARVGGSPTQSLRGHTQAIFEALKEAGIPWNFPVSCKTAEGNISFKDDMFDGIDRPAGYSDKKSVW